jgi:hypothetical protein
VKLAADVERTQQAREEAAQELAGARETLERAEAARAKALVELDASGSMQAARAYEKAEGEQRAAAQLVASRDRKLTAARAVEAAALKAHAAGELAELIGAMQRRRDRLRGEMAREFVAAYRELEALVGRVTDLVEEDATAFEQARQLAQEAGQLLNGRTLSVDDARVVIGRELERAVGVAAVSDGHWEDPESVRAVEAVFSIRMRKSVAHRLAVAEQEVIRVLGSEPHDWLTPIAGPKFGDTSRHSLHVRAVEEMFSGDDESVDNEPPAAAE